MSGLLKDIPVAILCAGLGNRLQPLTSRWPKPAVPLLGRPLFSYALEQVLALGVTRLAINTFHLPEVMEEVAFRELERLAPGQASLNVSSEATLQGTGGGIRDLAPLLAGDELVVLNGDVLFELDLAAALEAHRNAQAVATTVLLPMPEGETYNAVELDRQMRVRRIAGHGVDEVALSNWHFTGVHILSRRVFEAMPPGPHDINHDVYPVLIREGFTVHGHLTRPPRPYWSDLGTPQRYLATHQDLLFGAAGRLSKAAVTDLTRDSNGRNFWAHPSAQLNDVKVAGPAWFGAQSRIGRGVTIGSACSVGPNAVVADGASLNRVAVLDGAAVNAGARLEDAIVAPGGVVIPT